MWTRAELKDNAKKFFKFNYWKMVLVALVMAMVGGGGVSFGGSTRNISSSDYGSRVSPSEAAAILIGILVIVVVVFVVAYALSAFLLNPLCVGAQRFFVVSHYQKAELGELGYAFSNSYMNVVKTMFLRQLYISLWSLLFIIPGIIKGYEYRMIPYILAENPGISSKDAFAMSKQMMDGNKWNAFVLDLSFIGWGILSLFTCGILAIFYVNPYKFMTNAELYVALKEITFGNHNGSYQNNQSFHNSQNYQNYQGSQSYQPNQNYQAGSNYQGQQGYQSNQNYQAGANYQSQQGYQSYQSNQNYQAGYNYQGQQGYQGYQPDQNYQSDSNYQSQQGYQPNQYDQGAQHYQNVQGDLQNQGYQGGGQQGASDYDHQDNNFQM